MIEQDLDKIKKTSKEKEEVNFRFRLLMKQIDYNHRTFLTVSYKKAKEMVRMREN